VLTPVLVWKVCAQGAYLSDDLFLGLC
jgi:hypothetical protein